MKLLFLNGPNLNLLGKREPSIYGLSTLDKINDKLRDLAKQYQVEAQFFQSNNEGSLIDLLHEAELKEKPDFIIFNPGAYSHYSYALRDAVAAISIPVIEVHISNIYQREGFRHKSLIAEVAKGQISGFGDISYVAAFFAALHLFEQNIDQDRVGK